MEKRSTYSECACFTVVDDLFGWFASFVGNCESLVLVLDLVVTFKANKAPGVENSVPRVAIEHVLCTINELT